MKKILLVGLLLMVLINASSGQDRTKIALVLSGGGAKGMAHIPVLQALDSLGIVPDLVVGTSMGAVIGGLYAMGYSGDTLEQIASHLDWNALLSNKIPLNAIGTSEKDEFDRYALEVGIYKGKLEFPLGVIEGQELGMTLSHLFYPVRQVKDFDQLPIPFRCVTTDIVNGRKKVFKSGDIAQAIRASMAIPTIFTPVEFEETLLVDGGILDNFPVDIAVEEGANIIIGSDVSGGPSTKEELSTSLLNLVFQTGMIQSLRLNEENQNNATVLINHTPNLTYTTGDFNQARQIIGEGKVAVAAELDALTQLSQDHPSKPRISTVPSNKMTLNLNHVDIRGVDPKMKSLMLRRMSLELHEDYPLEEIERRIQGLYGLRLFKKLDYEVSGMKGQDSLLIKVNEKRYHSFKTGLHYDSDRGAGILFNLTSRNIIGPGSRMLTTVDVAENPSVRFQLQKPLGEKGSWWTRAELKSEKALQQYYIDNRFTDDYVYLYRSGVLQLNKELSVNDYLGAGLKMEFNRITPKLTAADRGIPKDSLTNEVNQLNNDNYGVFLRFEHNSYNRRFFPSSGSAVFFESQYNLQNHLDVDFYSYKVSNLSEDVRSNLKLELEYEQVVPISERSQLLTRLYLGHNFQRSQPEENLDFYEYGLLQYFFLGGLEQRRENYFIPFPGLRAGQIPASQISTFNIAWQYNLLPNTYFIPAFNVAAFGQGSAREFYQNFNTMEKWKTSSEQSLIDASWLQSISANLAYMSFLGPIQLEASLVNFKDLRLYFSLGFFF